jgi:iron complex transport system ATP-binding protein
MDRVTPALEFSGVTAGYRKEPVIRDVSLTLQSGDMAALIGPNGAGKTTLLRAITGRIPPSPGSVRLFGHEVSEVPAAERARLVGVVPQDMETPMPFTVEEVVSMGRTAALSRWRQPSPADLRTVERAMAYTDVIDLRDRLFTELSGGERQRAVIAMVLAQQPRLILMDEPTSHLDMNHRLEVMQIVERLNREEGVTVLVVSHDLNLAAEFCTRLFLLDKGQLVADGSPREVLNEGLLRRVYRCGVRVQDNPASGSVLVMPAPRPALTHAGRGIRVHVVAGGGCGEEVLRRLCIHDYTLTCGVLNEGDSDAQAAAALGIETALERPFSPIGPGSLASARSLVSRCDAVIVTAVPFGTGNAANLELAAEAARTGKPVFLMAGIAQRDYTPDHRATAIESGLLAGGARDFRDLSELIELLPKQGAEQP